MTTNVSPSAKRKGNKVKDPALLFRHLTFFICQVGQKSANLRFIWFSTSTFWKMELSLFSVNPCTTGTKVNSFICCTDMQIKSYKMGRGSPQYVYFHLHISQGQNTKKNKRLSFALWKKRNGRFLDLHINEWEGHFDPQMDEGGVRSKHKWLCYCYDVSFYLDWSHFYLVLDYGLTSRNWKPFRYHFQK